MGDQMMNRRSNPTGEGGKGGNEEEEEGEEVEENASQVKRSWKLEIENSQRTRKYRRVPLSSRAPVS